MKAYLALIRIDLKLALRNRSVIFFNYLFPLVFFFGFAQFLGMTMGARISYVVSMVLVLGILGNGLFGAGMRAVQERENNILRRFKVAPIRPTPLLVASMITGWVLFLPTVVVVVALAHFLYDMPIPERWLSFLVLVSIGVVAFRAIGLILAAVANSMQESNILIQILYMPMLFLSGATFPLSMLPGWARVTAQFLPASYLVTGFQGVFYRNETLAENLPALAALLTTIVLATFIATQLFRWEKEEKIRGAAKLWIMAVLFPFLILGAYQIATREHLEKADSIWKEIAGEESLWIRHVRIFVGDGEVLPEAAVLVRYGRIERITSGHAPGPDGVAVVEGRGKSLLPGLVHPQVHLIAPDDARDGLLAGALEEAMARTLRDYLAQGVTAVVSAGDALGPALAVRDRVSRGDVRGAHAFVFGPLFTAPGSRLADAASRAGASAGLPAMTGALVRKQLLRVPESAERAGRELEELRRAGVDGIEVVLPGNFPSGVLEELAQAARERGLPFFLRVSGISGLAEALAHEPAAIVHFAHGEVLTDELFRTMADTGVFYAPVLGGPRPELAREHLRRAYQAGVRLIAAGAPGKGLPEVLRQWVECGIPPSVALQSATFHPARALGTDGRMGLVQEGREANLILVEGDPLEDIGALEKLSLVILRGSRIEVE